jgi:hypothetical protein
MCFSQRSHASTPPQNTRAELDAINESLDRHAVDVASYRRALLDVTFMRARSV